MKKKLVEVVKCNGQEILVNRRDRCLSGELGGEQCEGCGIDLAESATVTGSRATCSHCESSYAVYTVELWD